MSDFSSAALAEHCYYCFSVLLAHLKKEEPPSALPFPDDGAEYPLFVTWNLSSRLRGCIGTFDAYPLAEGLSEYALTSALKDRRFHPISLREVGKLECGVSLLTAFEDCTDYLDWEVGVHGIYIHLPNPSHKQAEDESSSSSSGASTPRFFSRKPSGPPMLTATYLPDVIPAQQWTKVEAIDSAIRKAGWSGRISEDIRRSLRVRRYRSDKVYRTYDDYCRWLEERK